MKSYETTVYEVFEDTEKSEGRGPKRSIGFYTKKSTAHTVANGKGVMGYPGKIETHHRMIVIEDDKGKLYVRGPEIDNEESEDLILKEALKKLTNEEVRVVRKAFKSR